ncbi:hypothetical protein JHK82_039766 [Glycine max]|nr:hypothetical protein JHK86_039957 [Glycine max]KAG4965562.1 hypothetical protein JHK85_040537 [Glycine max]KAG5110543.1 hypothetical protein JHK82_039766 [Glycine max]KAG5121830.1 hypothetical protein JHK84_040170 [Glycine max]
MGAGKLIVRKRRASLNDFDRFKIMLTKIKILMTSLAAIQIVYIFMRLALKTIVSQKMK